MATDPDKHVFMVIDVAVGDSRLPLRFAVRADGLTLFEVGDDEGPRYDAMLDSEQLAELAGWLKLASEIAAASEPAPEVSNGVDN